MPKFSEQTVIKKKPHAERLVLVTREEWKAREPKEQFPPVPVPIQYIVLTWTDTDICEWPNACMRQVKKVQDDHMDNQGLPDIRYNFLVGTDKQMYEGRGWGIVGPTYPETIQGADEINGNSIEIAFIDKYMTEPSVDLTSTVVKFLAKELALDKVKRPVEFKAIRDNKFVRFSRLFEGEKVHECMHTEEDIEAARGRDQEVEEMLKEKLKELDERDSWFDAEVDEILEEQGATIKTKTPEEIEKEYGCTEYMDEAKLKEITPEMLKEAESRMKEFEDQEK